MKISAVILTKNEEKNIKNCLDHLNWCDEITVIDDFSLDKTREIAESRGAEVFKHKLNDNFANQRNFGLKKANNNWVLFVDADEIVPTPLAHEIVRRLKGTTKQGFYLPRQELFYGKPLKCTDKPASDWSLGRLKLLRLGKKNAGQWEGKVHETWTIDGEVGTLRNSLLHNSFPNLDTALRKINLYSSIQAKNLHQENKQTNLLEILFYPIAKLFKNFIWHQGFLDGTRGLIFCLIMSLHSFLARAKLWHLNQSNYGK